MLSKNAEEATANFSNRLRNNGFSSRWANIGTNFGGIEAKVKTLPNEPVCWIVKVPSEHLEEGNERLHQRIKECTKREGIADIVIVTSTDIEISFEEVSEILKRGSL